MQNISFFLTQSQVRDQTKDVTRRLGWGRVRPGQRLQACVKCQGRRPGEPLERLAVIEIVSGRREPLDAITADECRREGFPQFTPDQFIQMFCHHMKCTPHTEVTRLEFRYV